MWGTERRVAVHAGGRLVCRTCVVADRPLARMKGLLGRRSLPEGEGLLIRPAPSVHTFFMRFPIDVVFVDGRDRIVKIARAVAPWRMAGARGARHALELAAGSAAATGLREGDVLTFTPGEAAKGEAASGPGEPTFANVRTLGRVRVLVAVSDRNYVRVARFLLTRAGFEVATCAADRVLEHIERTAEHVVVLDASPSRADALRVRSALLTRRAAPAVVVVSDGRETKSVGVRILPKWGHGDDLVREVERAYLRLPDDEGLLHGAG